MSRTNIGPHQYNLNEEEIQEYIHDERYHVYTDADGTHALRYRDYTVDDLNEWMEMDKYTDPELESRVKKYLGKE